jgi:hypothetical protein
MNRNNNNRRRNRAASRRRSPQYNSNNNPGVNVASRRDHNVDKRRFTSFSTLPFTNIESNYAYTIVDFNIAPTAPGYREFFSGLADQWEEYKINRITIYASIGKDMTVNDKAKCLISSRVDVSRQNDGSPPSATWLRVLANAQNTTTRTFSEKNQVKIADYKPLNIVQDTTQIFLPNRLEWFSLSDNQLSRHLWRGAIIAPMIPETNQTVFLKALTITATIYVDCRGRISERIVHPNTLPNIPTDFVQTLSPSGEKEVET